MPADATLAELADAYARHLFVLAAARVCARRVPVDQLAAHAVAALALGEAITTDLHRERSAVVRDALAYGAGLAAVAAAVELHPDAVTAELHAGGREADNGGSMPAPLDREPQCVRPPFDDRWDDLCSTDTQGWRRALHRDRVAALLEPLDGVDLSERERAIVDWMAGWDTPTVAPLVRVLHAARAAAPFSAGGAR